MYGHEITTKRHFILNIILNFDTRKTKMAQVRIKDIAAMAGVSIGTVDRVIHHREGVSEATRKRIQKLLDEQNYSPHMAGRSLATSIVTTESGCCGQATWIRPGT